MVILHSFFVGLPEGTFRVMVNYGTMEKISWVYIAYIMSYREMDRYLW